MLLLLLGAALVLGVALLAAALAQQPDVPQQLAAWPSLPFLYLQLLRAAVKRKPLPKQLMCKPIAVKLTTPTRVDAARYAGFLHLTGFKAAPPQLPLSYPCAEAFRLSMLAMSHRDFPFNVLGAVLARNTSWMSRPIAADEPLTYTARVEPEFSKNDKGDFELVITSTASDASGAEVWRNSLTVIVINPQRTRGGGSKPAAAQPAPGPQRQVLTQLAVPGDAGRAYGALTGDRNPIHLSSLTSQLFGFKRPIAHAMYLVARLEAALTNAGFGLTAFPGVLVTEFKRPTPLPAKLQAVVSPTASPQLQCAVLTERGDKEVIVGRLGKP